MNAPGPRWQRRPEARRDELLDAARALLQERPLAEIKVSDITGAAGAAKGTFYSYFATRNDLFAALQERFLEGLIGAMEAARATAPADDWLAGQEAAVAAAIAYMYADQAMLDVWERDKPPHGEPDVFAIGTARIAATLADDIAAEVAAGRLVCDDPDAAAQMIVHAVDGAVSADMQAAPPDGALGRERVTRAALAMMRGLLR
jgi:AcrR family transcriptional regulator